MALLRSDRIISGLRRRFGISAPKLAVRTHWSWRIRGAIALIALLVLAALFYGGFDAGRLFAGFNVGKVRAEQERLSAEVVTLQADNERLRRDNIDRTNAEKMAVGARDVLSKQILSLQTENTQLKEEVAFFEKLMGSASTSKNGLAVQRLQAERESPDSYRFRALVVQGSAEAAFKGRLTMTASLVTDGNKAVTLNLPDDQTDLLGSLALDFKTYQRVEGVIKVPPNAHLKNLAVRVFATGSNTPKAQQSLQR